MKYAWEAIEEDKPSAGAQISSSAKEPSFLLRNGLSIYSTFAIMSKTIDFRFNAIFCIEPIAKSMKNGD